MPLEKAKPLKQIGTINQNLSSPLHLDSGSHFHVSLFKFLNLVPDFAPHSYHSFHNPYFTPNPSKKDGIIAISLRNVKCKSPQTSISIRMCMPAFALLLTYLCGYRGKRYRYKVPPYIRHLGVIFDSFFTLVPHVSSLYR